MLTPMTRPIAQRECLFDLDLAPITLEAGAVVQEHVVRGWWTGPEEDREPLAARATRVAEARPAPVDAVVRRSGTDAAALSAARRDAAPRRAAAPRLDPEIPTVLVVHALTGDARVGGEGGWWSEVVGPGRALDPDLLRVLCFNNLGSCYGTSGPLDRGFPSRAHDARFPAPRPEGKGAFRVDEGALPATVTTWDQARSILMALDALGIDRVQLVTGGSVGGMILLCLAALDPLRFERMLPFGATELATAWILGWNHIGRQAILSDPGFPADVRRGLEIARQIGHMSYRAEPGLAQRQGRNLARDPAVGRAASAWTSRTPYAVQTYLEYQGQKLRARFDARAYLAQIDAMDHHDLARPPQPPGPDERWPAEVVPGGAAPAVPAPAGAPELPVDPAVRPADPRDSWGLRRIRAAALTVGIDSDQLYFPRHMRLMAARLRALGRWAVHGEIESPHGHDAFLIEWDQVGALLARGLALPAHGTAPPPGGGPPLP